REVCIPFLSIYFGFEGKYVFHLNPKYIDRNGIHTSLRANWTAPLIISSWNHNTLYIGGNLLFKSVNRGDNWTAISPDLTKNYADWKKGFGKDNGGVSLENTGSEVAGTIRTISESPLKQGLLWVGTDDGNVELTIDDGLHWTNLTSNIPGLPKDT